MKQKRAMTFKVKIDLAGNAFQEQPESEIERILRDIPPLIHKGKVCGTIQDYNGNRCGKWEFTTNSQY